MERHERDRAPRGDLSAYRGEVYLGIDAGSTTLLDWTRARLDDLNAHHFSKDQDLSTWQRQLRYMSQLNLSQQLTNTAGLGSLTYIACTGDNVTVRQPEAAALWLQSTWGCRLRKIPTAHAAYLEARPVWEAHLVEIFRELGLLA